MNEILYPCAGIDPIEPNKMIHKKGNKKRKQRDPFFWCEACQIQLNDGSREEHYRSKKHITAVNLQGKTFRVNKKICSEGIVISGIAAETSSETVLSYLKSFGTILAFRRNDDTLLVQFSNSLEARDVLNETHVVEGVHLTVLPRPMPNNIDKITTADKIRYDSMVAKVLLDPSSSLDDQLTTLVNLVTSTEREAASREHIVRSLEEWLSLSFPGVRLLCFGSAASGLAFPNSDLDLYLDFPNITADDIISDIKEDADSLRSGKLELLKRASQVMQAHPDVIQPFLVSQARVPIFKFIHAPTGISCDVNCTTTIGFHNSNLIGSIVSSDTRIRSLFFLVKLWVKCQGFTGLPDSSLSSYAVSLFVLYYLQKRSILPSIESLQSGIPPLLIGGWNAAFRKPKVDCGSLELIDLLSGFFQFYKDFDCADDQVICPLIAGTVAKAHFEEGGTALPESMGLYVQKKCNFRFHPNPKIRAVAVQDMFELNHNTTFSFRQWESFRAGCAIAVEKIASGNLQKIFIRPPPLVKKAGKKSLNSYDLQFKFVELDGDAGCGADELAAILPAVAKFIGKLLTFSYAASVTEVMEEEKEASKNKRMKLSYDDMIIQWDRPYDIAFPFNIFHANRAEIDELFKKNGSYQSSSSQSDQSLLDRERSVTSLLLSQHRELLDVSKNPGPSFRLTMSCDPGMIIALHLANPKKKDEDADLLFPLTVEQFRKTLNDVIQLYLMEYHPSFTLEQSAV